eukprot:SAG31_NODE_4029_length_3650_cov_1.509716_6_plen_59_part_00
MYELLRNDYVESIKYLIYCAHCDRPTVLVYGKTGQKLFFEYKLVTNSLQIKIYYLLLF